MFAYKDALRTRIPFLYRHMIRNAQEKAEKAAAKLKGKEVIEVAFLLTIPGMWKWDYVFSRMQKSKKYHPYIVICPYSQFKNFSDHEIWETIYRTERFVKSRGFEYIIPCDKEKDKWEDIKKTLNPDIVFFTTPYRDILPQYYVYNFADKLTCYVAYGFVSLSLYALNYQQIATNLYGMYFVETPMHLDFAKKYAASKGANFVVTGYPGTEVYLDKEYKSPDVWETKNAQMKRVIWAPHHTIDGADDVQLSTFLDYYDKMLGIAERYKDKIHFAFKPHQLLKFKLIQLWGEDRTIAYYKQWETMENSQLEEADYKDLFIHSDAILHDCGGFTTEYLFTKKPAMYLMRHENYDDMFNDFGRLSFQQYYKAHNVDDIIWFLEEVVLKGDDPMKASREKFFAQYLAPYNGKMPSENIIEAIENKINNAHIKL